MSGRDGLNKVPDSIRLAQGLGPNPVEINSIILKGIYGHEIAALANLQFQPWGLSFIDPPEAVFGAA